MKYLIVPTADVIQEMIDVCRQSSIETLRKNKDESEALLKYEGTKPSVLSDYSVMTNAECRTLMLTDDWSKND